MNILGIIPARGGSKGVARKNLKMLAGRPLIDYTVQACQRAKCLDRVIISTDDEEIANFGRKSGIEVPFLRPVELAGDLVLMIDVVRHALLYMAEKMNYVADAVVLLQPTSPLRVASHIDAAIDLFLSQKPDTVVSVTQVPHHFVPESIYRRDQGQLVPFFAGEPVLDRHQKNVYFARNGPAILITMTSWILTKNTFYGNRILPFDMAEEDSIDIDTERHFEYAEYLIGRKSQLM